MVKVTATALALLAVFAAKATATTWAVNGAGVNSFTVTSTFPSGRQIRMFGAPYNQYYGPACSEDGNYCFWAQGNANKVSIHVQNFSPPGTCNLDIPISSNGHGYHSEAC
ncbi:hypothetical protein BGX26_004276 [Mortierella sp. AD094]|nr:hypothetical protein BGX26_004276 [Mortierella sp. AD094]